VGSDEPKHRCQVRYFMERHLNLHVIVPDALMLPRSHFGNSVFLSFTGFPFNPVFAGAVESVEGESASSLQCSL
jgi:hypothetical protein